MASLLAGAVPMAASQTALCIPPSPSLSRPQSLLSSSSSSSSSLSTSLSLSSPASSTLPFIYCGRGDKKTAKGKRFNRSFGNARPKDKKKGRGPPRVAVPPSPPRKDRYDDGEVVKIEIDESLG